MTELVQFRRVDRAAARASGGACVPIGAAAVRGGGVAAALGSYANSASPSRRTRGAQQPGDQVDEERRIRRNANRRRRHGLRARLRRLTGLRRVCKCGRVAVNGEGSGPGLRLTEVKGGRNVAGLSGLATCGSVWACPVCAAKIATRRAEELAAVERFALKRGCSASMVTLTMRHHAGQSLRDCWEALSKAWRGVTTGKQWTTDADRGGLVGWVRVVEVTHGANGWHVHVHALLIWKEVIDQAAAETIGERMWQRWTMALRRSGFDSLRDSGGLDVRLATLKPGGSGLHEYFVKLAHEMTGGQAKLARGGGRTPFQLLADAVEGLADEVDLWDEWEKASQGRRQMEWSRGRRDLRKWAGLGAERSDKKIAEEELSGDELVLLTSESWHQLRDLPDRVCDLLEAAEAGGFDEATALLDLWGMAWFKGTAAPPRPPAPPGSWSLNRTRFAEARDVAVRLATSHRLHTVV